MKRSHLTLIAATITLLPTLSWGSQESAIEELQEFMEFTTYTAGAIPPEQLEQIGYDQYHIIDTRNRGQFEAGHLPGAIHIEWRQILSHRDQLPRSQPILLYCETGLLSSKAHLALAVAGFDNVYVLWCGYVIWSARQSYEEASKEQQRKSSRPE